MNPPSTPSVVPENESVETIERSATGSIEPEVLHTSVPDHSLPPDLFPLPLTAFEKYMFVDDHRTHPRQFVVVMEFLGKMDEAAFEQAIRETIRRNPFLSATVKRVNGKLQWIQSDFPADQIRWEKSNPDGEQARFDLRKKPGFRVYGHTDGTTSEVRLIFHHAVADGHGARRVILDWITVYASMVTPDARIGPLDKLNYDRLRRRGEFAHNIITKPEIPTSAARPTLSQRFRNIYEFLSQQPTPLRPGHEMPPSRRSVPAHVMTHRFNRQDVKRFRDRLRGSPINLNDVSIALLLNSIARWNRAHGESGADRLYKVLVPVDLRESGDELMPAANRMSFVFITRPTSLCLDWSRLLKTIRDEMDYIDNHGCKYNLINVLPIVQSVPGLAQIGTRMPICMSTAVLTNLGDTVRRLRFRFPEEDGRPLIGNLQFVRAGGAPPLRPKTWLGIGLAISLGELVIHTQFDASIFSRADAEGFLSLFAGSWRNWVDGAPEFQ